MIPLASLWLPVLVAAILVFVTSSLIHMVLKYHNADYRSLPNEDAVREVLKAGPLAPGQYVIPHCADHKDMCNEPMKRKFTEGPVGLLWIQAPGLPNMGKTLAAWFAYLLVVSVFAGYVAARTLGADAPYLQVFRVAGTVAFLAYAGAAAPASIWMGKPWRATCLDLVDGLLYALVTAGAFGWLWPR